MRRIVLLLAATLFMTFSSRAQELVVHEWGTFTTLHSSDGTLLPGLYVEEEALPSFVHHHDGFDPENMPGKGIYRPMSNVTVKMETPVLYFYTGQSTDISVRVGFTHGTISQWFPQRSAGETLPGDSVIDFSKPFGGWIEWQGTVLPPNSHEELSHPENPAFPSWDAPRATDANLVRSHNGEVEKFLFYRGVGNFEIPLHAAYNAAGELVIRNNGAEPIPYVFVYNNPSEIPGQLGAPAIWWTGPLAAGEERTIAPRQAPIAAGTDMPDFTGFEDALVDAGLYRKEAASMLETWRHSYFGTQGLKVFWIVPRSLTDQLLPLSIQPAPTKLERVIVGRSEVLAPKFEQEIYDRFAEGMEMVYQSDRFFEAYKALYERMRTLSSVDEDRIGEEGSSRLAFALSDCTIYPNPSTGKYMIASRAPSTFSWTGDPYRLVVTDLIGNTVYSLDELVPSIDCSVVTIYPCLYWKEIDLTHLPDGPYFASVNYGGKQWLLKFIKW